MNRRQMLLSSIAGAVGVSLPIATAPTTPVVTLRLTPAEAQALANITSLVGGDPTLSDRGHIDTIRELLQEQGYSYQCGNIIKHTMLSEDGREYFHYNVINLRNYSEYQHNYPSGPGRAWQHSPDLRYLRRQRDGVNI